MTEQAQQVAIDPRPLLSSMLDDVWVETGKEPEKCLYNLVEILVFKLLSDIGVLTGDAAFQRLVELAAEEGDEAALDHYARVYRKDVRRRFPSPADPVVVQGTVFVDKTGEPEREYAALFGRVVTAFQAHDDEHGSLAALDGEFRKLFYQSFLQQNAGMRLLDDVSGEETIKWFPDVKWEGADSRR